MRCYQPCAAPPRKPMPSHKASISPPMKLSRSSARRCLLICPRINQSLPWLARSLQARQPSSIVFWLAPVPPSAPFAQNPVPIRLLSLRSSMSPQMTPQKQRVEFDYRRKITAFPVATISLPDRQTRRDGDADISRGYIEELLQLLSKRVFTRPVLRIRRGNETWEIDTPQDVKYKLEHLLRLNPSRFPGFRQKLPRRRTGQLTNRDIRPGQGQRKIASPPRKKKKSRACLLVRQMLASIPFLPRW